MRTVRRRTRWLIAVSLILVVAVAGVITVVLTTREDPVSSSCDLPESVADVRSRPGAFAPAGGGLKPVEAGWSPTADGTGMLLGAVVQNTSTTQVAYRTRVTFSVAEPDWFLEIPVILPGQRIGVGTRLDGTVSLATPQVLVGQTHWLDQNTDGRRFRPVTSTVQETGIATTSPYCRDVARHGVALLFRDATGRLIGGDRIVDGPDDVCPTGAGTDSGTAVPAAPAEADFSRTEAYAYCDTAAIDGTPTGAAGTNYRY